MSKLLDCFEKEIDSPTSSLSSSLSHTKSYKILEDLSRYINQEITGDFATHLVTSNHVVAIYRQGDTCTYFDSNVAFVQGLATTDELIEVVDKAVKLAGYKIEDEGLFVEHFDVSKANDQLTPIQKTILTKPIHKERSLFASEDEKLGTIEWDGR